MYTLLHNSASSPRRPLRGEKSCSNFWLKVAATFSRKLLQLLVESYCNFFMKVTATFFSFEQTSKESHSFMVTKDIPKTLFRDSTNACFPIVVHMGLKKVLTTFTKKF